MVVRKSSNMASRGTLAAGIGRGAADPDRSDASVPKFGLERRRALDEGAVACRADDQVFRADVEFRPELRAKRAFLHSLVAACLALRRVENVVEVRPVLK